MFKIEYWGDKDLIGFYLIMVYYMLRNFKLLSKKGNLVLNMVLNIKVLRGGEIKVIKVGRKKCYYIIGKEVIFLIYKEFIKIEGKKLKIIRKNV